MHLGLIGGIGPASTESNYRSLVASHKKAGANVAAITSLGEHFCYDEMDAYFKANGLKNVGLLGAKAVMQTHLYGGIKSANGIVPEGNLLSEVDHRYLDMAATVHVQALTELSLREING